MYYIKEKWLSEIPNSKYDLGSGGVFLGFKKYIHYFFIIFVNFDMQC